MTDKHLQAEADAGEAGNMKKDPDDWVTGEEPMTGAQKSYLKTLSEEAGEAFDEGLSKAEASKRIDALQASTGRGREGAGGHGGDPGGHETAPRRAQGGARDARPHGDGARPAGRDR